MKKALTTLFLIACLLAACALPARATVIVNANEIGGDVVFAGGGTFNLTDLTSFGGSSINAGIDPSIPQAFFGANPGTNLPIDLYGNIVSPGPFGPGGAAFPTLGSGDRFGVNPFRLIVPAGYTSGSMLNASNTYTGATFASLGVTPGTYIWSWGSGVNADSFTLNIVGTSNGVPESGSTALSMLLGLGALALLVRFGHRMLPARD